MPITIFNTTFSIIPTPKQTLPPRCPISCNDIALAKTLHEERVQRRRFLTEISSFSGFPPRKPKDEANLPHQNAITINLPQKSACFFPQPSFENPLPASLPLETRRLLLQLIAYRQFMNLRQHQLQEFSQLMQQHEAEMMAFYLLHPHYCPNRVQCERFDSIAVKTPFQQQQSQQQQQLSSELLQIYPYAYFDELFDNYCHNSDELQYPRERTSKRAKIRTLVHSASENSKHFLHYFLSVLTQFRDDQTHRLLQYYDEVTIAQQDVHPIVQDNSQTMTIAQATLPYLEELVSSTTLQPAKRDDDVVVMTTTSHIASPLCIPQDLPTNSTASTLAESPHCCIPTTVAIVDDQNLALPIKMPCDMPISFEQLEASTTTLAQIETVDVVVTAPQNAIAVQSDHFNVDYLDAVHDVIDEEDEQDMHSDFEDVQEEDEDCVLVSASSQEDEQEQQQEQLEQSEQQQQPKEETIEVAEPQEQKQRREIHVCPPPLPSSVIRQRQKYRAVAVAAAAAASAAQDNSKIMTSRKKQLHFQLVIHHRRRLLQKAAKEQQRQAQHLIAIAQHPVDSQLQHDNDEIESDHEALPAAAVAAAADHDHNEECDIVVQDESLPMLTPAHSSHIVYPQSPVVVMEHKDVIVSQEHSNDVDNTLITPTASQTNGNGFWRSLVKQLFATPTTDVKQPQQQQSQQQRPSTCDVQCTQPTLQDNFVDHAPLRPIVVPSMENTSVLVNETVSLVSPTSVTTTFRSMNETVNGEHLYVPDDQSSFIATEDSSSVTMTSLTSIHDHIPSTATPLADSAIAPAEKTVTETKSSSLENDPSVIALQQYQSVLASKQASLRTLLENCKKTTPQDKIQIVKLQDKLAFVESHYQHTLEYLTSIQSPSPTMMQNKP